MKQDRTLGARKDWASRAALPIGAILAIFTWLAFSQSLFNDGDTSWHLATGQLILATHSIPHADPFSYTFPGRPWTAHEWLAEVIMASVFRVAGWAGLAALFGAAIAATIGLLSRELLRRLPVRYALVGLMGLVAALSPFMLARPHVLTWPLFVVWLQALARAREEHRAPRLAWAALMLVWANLHGSYLLALGIAATFALEALLKERDRRGVLLGWGAFGLLSLLCAAVTPHGVQGFIYPLQVSRMHTLPLIQEWRSSRLPDDVMFFVVLAAIAILALLIRFRLTVVRVALLIALAAMAISQARHQPLFVITATVLLSAAVPSRSRSARLLVPLGLGVAAIAVVRIAIPLERSDGATYPARAINHLPLKLRNEPVLNSYSFGGPLILNGIRPYIDGRADMYGDEFTADHYAIILGDKQRFDRAADRFGIRWTILQPGSPLIGVLDKDARWRRLYADKYAVIHDRQ